MDERETDERLLRQYLLGTLPEEERAAVEVEALRDDGRFEELVALEDDILHEYAQGGLSDVERRGLEARLLATEHGRRRLEDARALLARLQEGTAAASPAAPTRWPRWLPVAAAALLALAFAFMWSRSLRAPAAGPSVATGPSPAPGTDAPPGPASPEAQPVAVVALALSPGLARGAATASGAVHIPAPDAIVELTLALPAQARATRYVARVVSAEGREAWSTPEPVQPAGQGTVVLTVPGQRLAPADYQVLLSAAGGPYPLAEYRFRVLRQAAP